MSQAFELIDYDPRDHISEADWTDQLRFEVFEPLGWYVYHTKNSRRSREGFPDLVAISPDGRVIYAELKRQNDYKVSDDQADVLDRLEANPANEVYLWRPRDLDAIGTIIQEQPAQKRPWRDWLAT